MPRESPYGPAAPPDPAAVHRRLEGLTRHDRLGRGPTHKGIARLYPWGGPSEPGGPPAGGHRIKGPAGPEHAKPLKGSPMASRKKRARLAAHGVARRAGGIEGKFPRSRSRSARHRMRAGWLASEPKIGGTKD